MYEINLICITAKHGGPVRSGPLSVHNKSVSTLEDLQIKQTRLPKKKESLLKLGKQLLLVYRMTFVGFTVVWQESWEGNSKAPKFPTQCLLSRT